MKLMAVPEEIADEAKEISETMNTTPSDAIKLGLEILRYSLGREITISKNSEDVEMHLPILKNYRSLVNLKKNAQR